MISVVMPRARTSACTSLLRSAAIGAIAACCVALPAGAQTVVPTSAQDQPADGEVVVTGSRLKQTAATVIAPLTTLTKEQIEVSGQENIGRALNNLPSMGIGFNDANSQGNGGSQGLNLINLRRLGTSRTLVLVNGRRQVPGEPLTSSVDLNTIPSTLVERVDVSLGGASAVYGADAVSGVVNLILKKNYDGLEARVRGGITTRGDGESHGATLTAGKNFADGRGNVTLAAFYDRVEGVQAVDRDYASNGLNTIRNPNANGPAFIHSPNIRFNGINDSGTFTIGTKPYVFANDGSSFHPYDFGAIGNRAGRSIGGDGGFFEKYDNLSLPTTRYVANLLVNYEFSPAARFFLEGRHATTKVLGFWQPPEDPVQYDPPFIAASNPYVSTALRQALAAAGQEGLYLSRNNNDFGRRGSDSRRDLTQVTAGFDGDLGHGWSYNVFAAYGRNLNNITLLNGRLQDRFLESVDVVQGANGPQCASETARAAGCLPLNLLGLTTADPAAIAYSRYDDHYRKTATLVNGGGSVTGTPFTLPAGPVQTALGVEYRRDSARTFPSAQLQAGNTFYPQENPVHGHVVTTEAFGELRVPLLKDSKLGKELSALGAFRVSDYSTNGTQWSWNAGGSYTPFEGLQLRAMRSKSVRAPNIGELYSPTNAGYFFGQDPCDASVITLSPNRATNCAALGVPAGYDAPTNGKTILGRFGGNPNLDPETARTWTVGLSLTPPRIPGLSIAVDYFNVDIRNAIDNVPAQTILENCVDQPIAVTANLYCAAVTRDPTTKAVTSVSAVKLNIGRLLTDGVDFNVAYGWDLSAIARALPGHVGVRLTGTYLSRLRYFSDANDPSSVTRQDGVLGNPDWSMLGSATYTLPRFSLTWQARYIGSQWITYFKGITPSRYDLPFTGVKTYHDVSIGYDLSKHVGVQLNVTNVLDTKPPARAFLIHSGIYDASIYPNLGTSVSVALTYTY